MPAVQEANDKLKELRAKVKETEQERDSLKDKMEGISLVVRSLPSVQLNVRAAQGNKPHNSPLCRRKMRN